MKSSGMLVVAKQRSDGARERCREGTRERRSEEDTKRRSDGVKSCHHYNLKNNIFH